MKRLTNLLQWAWPVEDGRVIALINKTFDEKELKKIERFLEKVQVTYMGEVKDNDYGDQLREDKSIMAILSIEQADKLVEIGYILHSNDIHGNYPPFDGCRDKWLRNEFEQLFPGNKSLQKALTKMSMD